MDDRLATHFAHLFIRDPIVIFSEDLKSLNLDEAGHFENLQSTNWQHMRFKPPPPGSDVGWRVEFRPMEIQVTDFENAAFAVFIVLVTRAILSFDLNFYIPIPKVDENMQTAHARDAVLDRRFHFRRSPFPRARGPVGGLRSGATSGGATPNGVSRPASPEGPVEDEYRLMSINEIVNGTAYARVTPSPAVPRPATNGVNGAGGGGDEGPATAEDGDFPGLIPLVESYLDSVNIDVQTRCELATYLDLIRQRASGELCTTARWIRDFVAAHPAYRHDSAVPEAISHDLVGAVIRIGERECAGKGWGGLGVHGLANLLGEFRGGCG